MPKKASLKKQRIDLLLVEKSLVVNQEAAQALVMAGEVTADGQVVTKPGIPVNRDCKLEIAAHSQFVSRGGLKLAYALKCFGVNANGLSAADIGSSTGGFTDCLLQHGASQVFAIDVGKGQLDWRLRRDSRVVVMEEVNAKYPLVLPQLVDLVTVDVSFISVEKIIPSAFGILKDNACLIALIKPQFEALRHEVGRGGVIRDHQVHALVLGRLINWIVSRGFRLGGLVASPIEGASGNREFFVLLYR
jgi:23S rRNA (cytidine1920-2'-O)/16S rRNA (cytidine1409-2'-O)-methyltransferase